MDVNDFQFFCAPQRSECFAGSDCENIKPFIIKFLIELPFRVYLEND